MKNDETSDPFDLTELEEKASQLEQLVEEFAPNIDQMNSTVRKLFFRIQTELKELRAQIQEHTYQPDFSSE